MMTTFNSYFWYKFVKFGNECEVEIMKKEREKTKIFKEIFANLSNKIPKFAKICTPKVLTGFLQ